MTTVFLDATCWVAAAGNPAGGSARLLRESEAGECVIAVTAAVLVEAERNIRAKMPADALTRFMEWVGRANLNTVAPTSEQEEAVWLGIVAAKDAHVLAGALKARADVLVTLDRKHILTDAVRNTFPIPVRDTREFFAARDV